MAPSTLHEYLRYCTVEILDEKTQPQGTGFFVAPGLILTCAHVVEVAHAHQLPIQVRWQGNSLPARVEAYSEIETGDDLALLRVRLQEHPCVLLYGDAQPHAKLYSYGYPSREPEGTSAIYTNEGSKGLDDRYMIFQQGQVSHGMSGAPLLNEKTGSVCGLMQMSRDINSNLGGTALQASSILRTFPELASLQQQFHQRDNRWAQLLSQAQRQNLNLNWLPRTQVPADTSMLVFISYDANSKDAKMCQELEKHLSLMKRSGKITSVQSANLSAGQEERKEGNANLERAHIILLLISMDYLASDHLYDVEMQHAMLRQKAGTARVIPIILRKVDNLEDTPFGGLVPLPRDRKPITLWPDRDEAWTDVTRELARVVKELRDH